MRLLHRDRRPRDEGLPVTDRRRDPDLVGADSDLGDDEPRHLAEDRRDPTPDGVVDDPAATAAERRRLAEVWDDLRRARGDRVRDDRVRDDWDDDVPDERDDQRPRRDWPVDEPDGDLRVRGDHDVVPEGRATRTVRERTWTFAPGQLVSFAIGALLVVVGVIAVLRAGLDGSLDAPVVEVLRLDHTAWLGLGEIGLGLLLLLAGSGPRGRPLSVVLGVAMVVAGVLVLAEVEQIPEELAAEPGHGWALMILGALAALAAMALPVWRRRELHEDDLVDLRDRLGAYDERHDR